MNTILRAMCVICNLVDYIRMVSSLYNQPERTYVVRMSTDDNRLMFFPLIRKFHRKYDFPEKSKHKPQ